MRSDGHNLVTHGAGMIGVEFKNRILGSVEFSGRTCYIMYLNAMMNSTEAHWQLYLAWRVPCVSLTIVGELDFSAFQWLFNNLILIGYKLEFYAVTPINHHFIVLLHFLAS
jgi:hypothetical protein